MRAEILNIYGKGSRALCLDTGETSTRALLCRERKPTVILAGVVASLGRETNLLL